MPRGIEHAPKNKKHLVQTKLTAVTMSCNGRKVNTFIMLPIINGKAILPQETADKIMDDIGAERGDTIGMG
jgi:hypothetical protein